jgi:3'-phosphoadenosine 5'-phosphosulfate sulfotransferase (PAPS reductase)/FAD synthetase
VIISSEKYKGFHDLCISKKRAPSIKARFCTEELKLKPMREYINSLSDSVELYLGIRADESASRANMQERDYSNFYECDVVRPLLHWSASQCFDLMKRHNIEPNPLYRMGFSRVGCMPCIMARHSEAANIIRQFPDVIENIRTIEKETGRTFFPPNYIPSEFCTKRDSATGVMCPAIDDVVRYLADNKNQQQLFETETKCMSIYGICE